MKCNSDRLQKRFAWRLGRLPNNKKWHFENCQEWIFFLFTFDTQNSSIFDHFACFRMSNVKRKNIHSGDFSKCHFFLNTNLPSRQAQGFWSPSELYFYWKLSFVADVKICNFRYSRCVQGWPSHGLVKSYFTEVWVGVVGFTSKTIVSEKYEFETCNVRFWLHVSGTDSFFLSQKLFFLRRFPILI